MRADEGRALTGLRAEAWPADPQELQPGEAYVLGVGDSGLVRVRVPLLSPARAGAYTRAASEPASNWLQGGSPPAPLPASTEPDWSPNGAGSETNGSQDGALSGQDFRIAELFDEGHDIADIVRKVFDVTSGSGSRYQRASKEVQAALRRVRQS